MRLLYHGSNHIIESPVYGGGSSGNDYGQGFYCTENTDLAKEWACLSRNGGFIHTYNFDEEGLQITNLSSAEFNVLNWMAILLKNREIRLSSAIEESGKDYIIEHYMPDINGSDIIIGYRADDSFFSFSRAFLRNTISYQQLQQVLKLGDLGLQYVLVSERAFERIHFLNAEAVDGEVYYPKRAQRDLKARDDYRALVRSIDRNGVFLSQIIGEEMPVERL